MTEKKDSTDRKNDKTEPVTHSDMDITGPEIIVSGISGTKTLRVGRVNQTSRAAKQETEVKSKADETTSIEKIETDTASVAKPSVEKAVEKPADKPASQVSASAQVTQAEVLPKTDNHSEVSTLTQEIKMDSEPKPKPVTPQASAKAPENRTVTPNSRANTVRTDRSTYVPGSDNRPRQGYADRGPSSSGPQGGGPRPGGNSDGPGGPRPGGNSYGPGGPRPGGKSYGQG